MMPLLSYKKLGEGSPLIILHGLFGALDNWMTLAKEFATSHTVYLIDQRNHGQSFHDNAFNYDCMADDLKTFIEQLKIEDPIILGHSMGGKTAMNFAVRFPELLRLLIVVDIAPGYYAPHHQLIIEGLRAVDPPTLESRGQAEERIGEHIADAGTKLFLLKNLKRSASGFEWKMNLEGIVENIEQVGQALPKGSQFDKPTLFIAGGNSDYITEEREPEIHEHFPESKIVSIAQSGHWVHAEQPEKLLEVVQDFIANN